MGQRQGKEGESQVWPGWGMQGGGWQLQQPSVSPPSALTLKKNQHCPRGCCSWGIQPQDDGGWGKGTSGIKRRGRGLSSALFLM